MMHDLLWISYRTYIRRSGEDGRAGDGLGALLRDVHI